MIRRPATPPVKPLKTGAAPVQRMTTVAPALGAKSFCAPVAVVVCSVATSAATNARRLGAASAPDAGPIKAKLGEAVAAPVPPLAIGTTADKFAGSL